ncbi:phage tail protein [Vibrio parahaemolyticus]
MSETPENQQQYGSILTILGENAEQNGKLQNKQITFTHIAIGDANDTYIQPDRKQTALTNELARIPVNSVDVLQPTPESVPMLKVEAILPDDVNDLVIREFAAVATFDGNTYFHAVGNCARIYVPAPVNNGNVSTPVTLEMIFVITSADPIVEIDPNVITASRQYVNTKVSESDENMKNRYGLFIEDYKKDSDVDYTNAFIKMLDDGVLALKKGIYDISDEIKVDLSKINRFAVESDVTVRITSEHDGLKFYNITSNYDFNGMQILIDMPEEAPEYNARALEIHGTDYYPAGNVFSKVSYKTRFVGIYCYNKQGHLKKMQSGNGSGSVICCNSKEGERPEILVWNKIEVSCTGFYQNHAFDIDNNELNFMSSCDIELTSWSSPMNIVDLSRERGNGNTSAGTGDNDITLRIQPDTNFKKAFHIENGKGIVSGRFKVALWDALIFKYKLNVFDVLTSNTYTGTLDNKDYNMLMAANYKDLSIFPVANIESKEFISDKKYYTDTEVLKYHYLKGVDDTFDVVSACKKISDNYIQRNIRHSFCLDFCAVSGSYSYEAIKIIKPFLDEINEPDPGGYLKLEGYYALGKLASIRFVYESDGYNDGHSAKEYAIEWNKDRPEIVVTRCKKYTSGTTEEIENIINPVFGLTSLNKDTGNLMVFNGSWSSA